MTSLKYQNGYIEFLDADEVIKLHNLLTTHPEIKIITEPVSPSGVKDIGLLESAIGRQTTGFGKII